MAWRPPPPTRPRLDVDTVASVGAAAAGLSETQLRHFFASLPGFVAFKAHGGGGFAKFESCGRAQEAVLAAQAEGIPGAMARSSMAA